MLTDAAGTGRALPFRIPLSAVEMALHRLPPYVGPRAITIGLRLAGVRLASSSIFFGAPRLLGSGDVAARLEIGELCGFNFGCVFELEAPISIAEHVAVGHQVLFLTRTRDAKSATKRGEPSGAQPIRVESGCWLGSRVTVLPGVTIGAGSVVGANVVVKESLPPNTLLAGARKLSLAKWR